MDKEGECRKTYISRQDFVLKVKGENSSQNKKE